MLFRNTSPPSNPFASSNSLTFVINNKGNIKPLEKNIANKYNSSSKISKLRNENYSDRLFNYDINEKIQDNPFEKYTNLRDLTTQGILQKHKRQKLKNQSLSPSKIEYQNQNISKFELPNQNNRFSTLTYLNSTRSFSPQVYESQKLSELKKNYFTQYNNLCQSISTFVPIVSETPLNQSHQLNNFPHKKLSKFKPSSNLNTQISKSPNKISCSQSIVQYFSNKNQPQNLERNSQQSSPKSIYDSETIPQSKDFDPFQSQLLKNDSIMSYSSQKQNYSKFKTPQNNNANNLYSSTVNKQSVYNNKQNIHYDLFDEQNNQNHVYESFVEQQNTHWPQFIEIMNTKFYYKHLKLREKVI